MTPTRADILGNCGPRDGGRAEGREEGQTARVAVCRGREFAFATASLGPREGGSVYGGEILEAEVPVLGCEAGERVWNDGAEDVSPMCSLSA